MNQPHKKLGLSVLLAIFSATTILGSLFTLTPARAQWTIVGDLPRLAEDIGKQIKEGLGIAMLNGALRMVSYAARKAAYGAAVWAASGGKGQKPVGWTDGFGSFLVSTADEAFGEALSAIEDQFGVTLCKIPDIKLDLALRIGLRGLAEGPPVREGSCSFQDFKKVWADPEAWKNKYGSEGLTQQFNASLKIEDTDFGIYLNSVAMIDQNVVRSRTGEILSRIEGQGTKPITDLISGNILTPAQAVKKYMDDNAPTEQAKQDQAIIAAAIGSGFYQIIPSTISMFLNTLAGQMLKNFREKGMFPFGLYCTGEGVGSNCKGLPGDFIDPTLYAGAGLHSSRQAANAVFNGLLKPTLGIREGYDTTLLAELGSCPDESSARSAFNCRADSDLLGAIREANDRNSKPLTIQDALDGGWLRGGQRLYGPSREGVLGRDCYQSAYCYSNIKVLRLARIFPLGFEIAALNSNPDDPWTLQEVVEGYNNCSYIRNASGEITGVNYDPVNHPFCHLIDPNWVIKIPPSKCSASVFGNQPLSGDVPNRLEECVDLSSAVAYDSNNNPSSYAYCAREKNVWNPNADTCSSYYATCLAYTAPTGQQVAYLQRTLDTGNCSVETVGCSAYSLTQDASGWVSPAPVTYSPYNTGIHFNNKVSSACGPNSAGCSAFKLADNQSARPLNLRKAPDYLYCYDANTATKAINWPQTTADLSRLELTAKPQCDQYAAACIPSEVGCNRFTAKVSGMEIPGKFTPAVTTTDASGNKQVIWNDQCDQSCENYDAYVRLADNYSNGSLTDYIIPTAVATCSREEVGCSGFTNMKEISAGGVEQVEYFSLLRSCIAPDANKQKNYYTYEGADRTGYQLKVYTLEQDPDAAGAPKYFYKDDAERDLFNRVCDVDVYNLGNRHPNYDSTLSPDCRQFNDEQGHVYYRLLGKTVVVSDKCTPYRFNSVEMEKVATATDLGTCESDSVGGHWFESAPVGEQCRRCFQNGDYKDGFCYYNGLPGGVVASEGQSQSCSAAVESCHAYKGNAGNNIEIIVKGLGFGDNLGETAATALTGWRASSGAPVQSTESTKARGHSLGYNGSGYLWWQVEPDGEPATGLNPGASYILSFWAKGSASGNLKVNLDNGAPIPTKLGEIQLSDVWRLYEFGAKELSGNVSSTRLTIGDGNSNAKIIYLDNLRLTKVRNSIYLVQKKLTVGPLCDADQIDNLPGEALGCKAYTVPNIPSPFYLKNFSYLCRENAIGCTALTDTYNTLSSAPSAYNVFLTSLDPASSYFSYIPSKRIAENQGKTLTWATSTASFGCTVSTGEYGCYVNILGYTREQILLNYSLPGGRMLDPYLMLTGSSVYVPADTTTSTPVYLVADESATCNQVDLGCTYAGLQRQTPAGIQFTTVTIKNDPATYVSADGVGGTLCAAEAVGCNAYTSANGTSYFKDPVATGQKICAYNSRGVTVEGAESFGWFWKNVGKCAVGSPRAGEYCSANSDCGAAHLCEDINKLPCYPEYRQDGNVFGIWSYGDRTKYSNFAGECAVAQSGCTEFVDHNDYDSDTGLFQSYFWINNSKIDRASCSGQVSLKDGCVLFDQVDAPRKDWHTTSSYAASIANDSRLVPPTDLGTGRNDANVIIKVTRDRECGEWLQCKAATYSEDGETYCYQIGRCNQVLESDGPYNQYNCSSFVRKAPANVAVLTAATYQTRKTAWGNMDYSGYSFLNMYQPDELEQINLGSDISPQWRLAHRELCAGGSAACNTGINQFACTNDSEGVRCGRGNSGVCFKGTCVKTHRGDADFTGASTVTTSVPRQLAPSCRSYPEVDSPFPVTDLLADAAQYEKTNRCSESGVAGAVGDFNCECDYTKAVYGNNAVIKYFNYDRPNKAGQGNITGNASRAGEVPDGICQGGDDERGNRSCRTDADCFDGICQRKRDVFKSLGWHGYCLEYDYSRLVFNDPTQFACLTWLPVEKLSGFADLNSQHPEAGYMANYQNNGIFGQYYCIGESESVTPIGEFSIEANTNDNSISGTIYNSDNTDALVYKQANHQKYSPTAPYPSQVPVTYNQSEIEYVEFKVGPDEDDDRDTEDPKSNTVIRLYPNLYNGNSPYFVGHTDNDPEGEDNKRYGTYVAGNFMGRKDKPAFFYSSKVDGTGLIDDNGIISPMAESGWGYISGNLFGEHSLGQMRIEEDHGVPRPTSNISVATSSMSFFDINYMNLSSGIPYTADETFISFPCTEAATPRNNWHGVVMNFDPDTKNLLGYYLFYCDGSDNAGNIRYTVAVKKRQICTRVADTVVDALSRNSAVAWTNRLWRKQNLTAGLLPAGAIFDSPTKPFGSLGLFHELIEPFDSSLYPGQLEYSPIGLSDTDPNFCSDPAHTVGYEDPGTPLYGTPCVFRVATATSPRFDGKVYNKDPQLKNLFVKSRRGDMVFRPDELTLAPGEPRDSNYYSGYRESAGRFNFTYPAISGMRAPTLLGLGECNPAGQCLESTLSNFNLNDQNFGSVILDANSGEASLKFFVYADPERMPIRNIQVDWGDGLSIYNSGDLSSFRNRRGAVNAVCTPTDPTVPSSPKKCKIGSLTYDDPAVCSGDTDCQFRPQCLPDDGSRSTTSGPQNFGLISGRTCDNNFYQFDYSYDCIKDTANPTWQPTCDLDGDGVSEGCCEFRPKVLVKDNWGWCTGGSYDGNNTPATDDDNCTFAAGAGAGFIGVVKVPANEEATE